jgi:hypothetical protein
MASRYHSVCHAYFQTAVKFLWWSLFLNFLIKCIKTEPHFAKATICVHVEMNGRHIAGLQFTMENIDININQYFMIIATS